MRRDRAWRRSQRERIIANVETWMRFHGLHAGNQVTTEQSLETYHKWARSRHAAKACCSGFCCGNPRRHHGGKTLAERRFYEEPIQG